MKRMIYILLFLVIISLACAISNNISENYQEGIESNAERQHSADTQDGFQVDFGTGQADLGSLDMSLAKLGSFAARFEVRFEGDTDWLYQVDTRYDGKRTEYSLHIEGVDRAQNPGDIRLVNVNGINRMKGPGTEEQCFQFPDEMETGLLFLNPADFIDPQDFSTEWKEYGVQTIADIEATTYQAKLKGYRGWNDVEVEYAIDQESEAVILFSFRAKGVDPLFGYGKGKIIGQFTILKIGYQEIKQVGGCKPIIPLPDDATEIIILPGLTSFQTAFGPLNISQFYDRELKGDWRLLSTEINDQTRDGWLVYANNDLQLTMHIEPNDPEDFSQGFLIKLYDEGVE